MPKYVDTYLNDLEAIQNELVQRLRLLIPKLQNLSSAELIEVGKGIDLLKEMDALGFSDALKNLYSGFNGEVVKVTELAAALNVPGITETNLSAIKYMAELELTAFANEAKVYASNLQREIVRGMMTGTSVNDLAERLSGEFTGGKMLTGPQKRVVVNDAFSRLSNATTRKVFEDAPEQRFEYIGPDDSLTRDECSQALASQPSGGWTAAEINGLGYVDFDSRGGWNCRHDWIPVA